MIENIIILFNIRNILCFINQTTCRIRIACSARPLHNNNNMIVRAARRNTYNYVTFLLCSATDGCDEIRACQAFRSRLKWISITLSDTCEHDPMVIIIYKHAVSSFTLSPRYYFRIIIPSILLVGKDEGNKIGQTRLEMLYQDDGMKKLIYIALSREPIIYIIYLYTAGFH